MRAHTHKNQNNKVYDQWIEEIRKIKRWKRQKVGWKQEEEKEIKKKTRKEKKNEQREPKKQENIIKLVETESNANNYLRFPCLTFQKEGKSVIDWVEINPPKFSLKIGEIRFWWARGENT